jgi:hypothetical protein
MRAGLALPCRSGHGPGCGAGKPADPAELEIVQASDPASLAAAEQLVNDVTGPAGTGLDVLP